MDVEAALDRNGMVVLSEHECFKRLGRNGVGRIAVTVGALPPVLPINYAFRGRDVYFRTAAGTKLAAAARNAVVAFEVDHIDCMDHTGWSVLVVGRAAEVLDPAELERLQDLPLSRWLGQGAETLVRINGDVVSGRAISPNSLQ
jgi:nitroimidazol reductase NimA-like FMN-containing flavoprotein (pyridoxamine 5'-phosphate oxidase superfamily)